MRSFLFLLILLPMGVLAQFIYRPLPPQQSDFSQLNSLKYTKCLVYKIEGEEKTLVKEAEYGNMGLIAALYEKGTNDDGDSVNTCTTYFKFNGKGKLIQIEVDNLEDDDWKSLYSYDASGRLVKKQTATIDPPTYTYQYDAKGRLIQAQVVQRYPVYDKEGEPTGKSADRPTYRYKYEYDASGRVSQELMYHMEEGRYKLQTKFAWSYDAKGRVVTVKRMDKDGKVEEEDRYEYNAEGLLSRSVEKSTVDETETVYVFEYNRDKQSWME